MKSPIGKTSRVTSFYGMRTLGGVTAMHNGIDLVPSDGKHPVDVVAIADGTVTAVLGSLPDSHTGLNVTSNTAGNYVYYDITGGYNVKCMHLKAGSVTLKKGDRIKAGDKLGTMGTTGRSTGVHLHYGVTDAKGSYFDPYPYLDNSKPFPGLQSVTGDPATRPEIKLGSSGEDVRYLQSSLNAIMKAGLAVDGSFGPATETAVKTYQKSRNLLADGRVYAQTWGAIAEDLKGNAFPSLPADNGNAAPIDLSKPTTTSTGADAIIAASLAEKGLNWFAVAGLMGNLFAESAFKANNLQNSYEGKLGYNDDSYTAAVDNGSYGNFVHDSAGYGLAQWTYRTRKEALLKFARERGASIGNLHMQLEFLWKELQGYPAVMNVLKVATSVRQASDVVLLQFERPADQGEAVRVKRAGYGQTYYDKFNVSTPVHVPTPVPTPVVPPTTGTIVEGSQVKIRPGAKYYSGKDIPDWVMKDTWIVSDAKGDRVVINQNLSKKNAINSPVKRSDLILVK